MEAHDVQSAGRELLKVLRLDDDHPSTRLHIQGLLESADQVVTEQPGRAMDLIHEAAKYMLEPPALATRDELEEALKSIGGLNAIEASAVK